MASLTLLALAASGLLVSVAVLRRGWATFHHISVLIPLVTVAGGLVIALPAVSGDTARLAISAAMMVAVGLVAVVTRGRSAETSLPRQGLALSSLTCIISVYLMTVDLANNALTLVVVFSRLIAVGIWLLVILLTMTRAVTLETFARVSALSLAVLCVSFPALGTVWRPCDQFKCGVAGELLTGPFPSENFLGLQALFTASLALVALRQVERVVTGLMCVLLLLATGSRTSLYVLVAVIALYLVLRALSLPRRDRGGGWQRALSALAAPVSVVGAAAVLVSVNPGSFSNRGAIWLQGTAALQGHLTFGLGLDRWEVLRNAGLVPDHFTHSQFLLILFGGGSVGVVLYTIWIAVAAHRLFATSSFRDGTAPCLLLTVIAAGITEAVWNPLAFDSLSWMVIALCVAVQGRAAVDGTTAASGRQDEAAIEDAVVSFAPVRP